MQFENMFKWYLQNDETSRTAIKAARDTHDLAALKLTLEDMFDKFYADDMAKVTAHHAKSEIDFAKLAEELATGDE